MINLGRTEKEKYGDMCSPLADSPSKKGKDKKIFPSFYFDTKPGEEIPMEGTATIKFKVKRRSEENITGDDGTKSKCEYVLEVQEIGDFEEGDSGESDDSEKDEGDEPETFEKTVAKVMGKKD